MKQWGIARGRLESEIARKREHLTVATNFEEARGWKRQQFKTKHLKPAETLDEFLASSSSEEEDSPSNHQSRSPQKRQMKGAFQPSPPKVKIVDLTEDTAEYNVRPTTEVMVH
mmetsp:Transcript_6749/g.11322  ORF Transcript_6749/g.11322 Transcript_6749/m.11322 type:complete len:113 (+) Transcript_6749:781-1119(+)